MSKMKLSEFNYELPEELIAKYLVKIETNPD